MKFNITKEIIHVSERKSSLKNKDNSISDNLVKDKVKKLRKNAEIMVNMKVRFPKVGTSMKRMYINSVEHESVIYSIEPSIELFTVEYLEKVLSVYYERGSELYHLFAKIAAIISNEGYYEFRVACELSTFLIRLKEKHGTVVE